MKATYNIVTHDIICCSDIHGHNCAYCSHSENGKPHERCMEELLDCALRLIEIHYNIISKINQNSANDSDSANNKQIAGDILKCMFQHAERNR